MISYTVERFGCYEIYEIDNEDNTLFVQTDWDFPGLASTFGWIPCEKCSFTDGTVDCEHKSAGEMISDAIEFLDSNEGKITEDPGYF